MIQVIGDTMNSALGLSRDPQQLTLLQMGLRAIVIYAIALGMVRVGGDRRFIAKHAALDVLLTIILGSTLSRAINGSAPFFETLGAAFALVLLHWLLALIAFHFDRFDPLIKGRSHMLIQDGEINHAAMKKSHISYRDLKSSLRLKANLTDPSQVEQARLEASGEISIILKDKPPRVIELPVKSGVQTVRIQLN